MHPDPQLVGPVDSVPSATARAIGDAAAEAVPPAQGDAGSTMDYLRLGLSFERLVQPYPEEPPLRLFGISF